MAIIFYNAWLEEQDYLTRIKEIPWEGYHRASLITSDDLALLQPTSGLSRPKQENIWKDQPQTYLSLYIRLLSKLNRTDCLHAVLVSLGDILSDNEDRVQLVPKIPEFQNSSPFDCFTRHLSSSDLYVRSKALSLLSFVLGSQPKPPSDALSSATEAINVFLGSQEPIQRELATECLQHILRQPGGRMAVWRPADSSAPNQTAQAGQSIIPRLVDMVRVGNRLNAQLQYRMAFCFWLLTFDTEVATNLNRVHGAIPLLVELARHAVKEKVIRVLVATFKNLVEKAPQVNLSILIVAANSLPLIQSFSSRQWSDQELKDDITWLEEQLQEAKRKMTTYDEYSVELESGLLRWSPPHTSEDFWSQNADKLNRKDQQQLKALIKLLSEASDPVVLAVAANDISKYVKHCEVGKRSVERLGAKTKVMNLMSHEDPDVKYWALVSVQQLISQPWAL